LVRECIGAKNCVWGGFAPLMRKFVLRFFKTAGAEIHDVTPVERSNAVNDRETKREAQLKFDGNCNPPVHNFNRRVRVKEVHF
jgi:hypothetical protein